MRIFAHSHLQHRFALCALLGFSAWLFLWNLGASSISLRSDEVIYVRITQNVLHQGDIFPLTHGNVPTYEKPAIKLWLAAIAPALLGESNLSFRLLDGLLGVITVGLTVALGVAITRRFWLGFAAGVLILGMPELVISHHGFRRAVLDGLLSVLTLLAALSTWRGIERSQSGTFSARHCLTIGSICALAVLTKSVAGFVPAACALISISVCVSPFIPLRPRASWSIIIFPVLAFVLYGLALGIVGGAKALKVFLGVEILARVTQGFTGHNADNPGFYWWYLFVRGASAPRLLLAVGTLGSLAAALKHHAHRFLLVWGLLPVILYSCAASRVPWYLNPFLPFLALISVTGSAYLCQRLFRLFPPGGSAKAVAAKTVAVLAVTLLIAVSGQPLYRALARNVRHVLHDSQRLELDLLTANLRRDYSHFAIIENALSGRTQPRQGRFNVEGIYRETLRPNLRIVRAVEGFIPEPKEVVFVKASSLDQLPKGWIELGRAIPFGARTWGVVAVLYG
jgi:4-amino-4-deoxy-L-arabinose transferase-like glycosyltransferase